MEWGLLDCLLPSTLAAMIVDLEAGKEWEGKAGTMPDRDKWTADTRPNNPNPERSMRLFQAVGTLTSAPQVVPVVAELPKDCTRDVGQVFRVAGGKFSHTFPAFDAKCAALKARRHFPGLINELIVVELPGQPFHPCRWVEFHDKNGNYRGGEFRRRHPSYGETVEHPAKPEQVRMLSVHRRLTGPSMADLTTGWQAATATYSARKKAPTALKAAVKSHKPANLRLFSAGFLRQWQRLASKPAKKVARRQPKPAADLFSAYLGEKTTA